MRLNWIQKDWMPCYYCRHNDGRMITQNTMFFESILINPDLLRWTMSWFSFARSDSHLLPPPVSPSSSELLVFQTRSREDLRMLVHYEYRECVTWWTIRYFCHNWGLFNSYPTHPNGAEMVAYQVNRDGIKSFLYRVMANVSKNDSDIIILYCYLSTWCDTFRQSSRCCWRVDVRDLEALSLLKYFVDDSTPNKMLLI